MTNPIHTDSSKANADSALQNWHAMAPGMDNTLAHLALTSADTILYQWNMKTGRLTFSQNIADVLPSPLELPRTIDDWQMLIDPQDLNMWHMNIKEWKEQQGRFEMRYRIDTGESVVWVKHSVMNQLDNDVLIGVIGFNCMPPRGADLTQSDLSELFKKDNNSKARRMINAGEFICQLDHYQHTANPKSGLGSVMIIAITSMPMIAQAFGQSAVETVMEELEDCLKNLLGNETLLFRINRDQFGLIFNDFSEITIEPTVETINQTIRDYGVHSSVGAIHTSSVCGYKSFTLKQDDAATLIDRAYSFLNRTPGMLNAALMQETEDSVMARQQMGLANYLTKALREDKLRLAYQPIIDSKTGDVAYYEALLRLVDEKGRISSAGALIPVAERMGLIDMVDRRVLEMVYKELDTYPTVKLALNVSNLTTENPEWLSHAQDLLRDRPDISSRLTIEITETAAQRDLRRTAYFVAMVQDLGCLVSLDDFGSGYTSFRQLKTLSVDSVKIDGAFIRDLTDSADNRFFVKTLLEFTELFGLKSVAEYVETGEGAKLLMELGVDYMQGYYFGKPENQRSWLAEGEYKPS